MAWTQPKKVPFPLHWTGGNETAMNDPEIEELLADLERLQELEERLRVLKAEMNEANENS